MEKYFGEKQERFSFRKLSVGLVSATISSLFFMSVLGSSSVEAQETKGVHYKYVTESELSSDEKKQLVYDIPTYMENDDETYYLVYKLNSQNQLGELPNTGSKNDIKTLVAGASLAALGILIFAVSKKKVKNKTVLHLVLVAGIGNGVLVSAHALENNLLLNYNTDYELTTGEKLPLPKEISGYTYIGYIKEGKTTSDFEVSNQEKSAATPTKQQKVDYNVTPNFVDHPSTVQAIQEQTPVSSTKSAEVQVVEKPFSTELINPRKEEKQSSDSQEQLAEHKNLETKKEEKISPKEKTGVNTLNPQDEVLSGQLNKPELLYREETIETKIDFQEEIQENPDLAEGTVRVKQEGKLGKKVEIVRIFSVNKEEVSREIVSTSTTAPIPRIVEKGTKKTQVIKEQPETGIEHKDVQSGAIVEPAVQPSLPEAVVSDKGEPEVQPELPEAVVTDKGEPEQVAPLPEYKGNIEQVKPETPVEKTKEQGPEKTEEVPVNPNEGTVEGTSNQETEKPVQPAEETQTNSGKIANENTGEVSNKPSDSKPPVEESNQPEKNGTATKPENSGNTTSENGQPEPEPSNGNSTEDVSTESNTSNSNGNEEIKQENELDPDKKVEDPEKKLELRNVSDIELYSQTNGTYRQHVSLDGIPENTDTYFVKVKSSAFKDVYIPVASITEEKRNGQSVYKITAKAEKLQQELENKYVDNFTFYLDKKAKEENTNFTSFSNLVKAINQNPSGTYHLAASLNANEVELGPDERSYIKDTFTGRLIGEKDGKNYAIYNLKKPLFENLSGATVEKLSLKNVAISGKDDIGSLAYEAKNGTTINEVHVDGLLGGERGIGGLVAKVDQSNITNSSFTGRIVNTYETKSAYNIGGLVGHLTGDRASINSSKSTVVISSNTNSSDQTVGGISGLVDKDAHIQNSYSEGDINNSQRFGKVAGIAGNLWDRESNSENHAGRLTNVLSDVNVTNGNAISGYHYNGMKITDAFSNKANKVFNVTLEKDEVVSKESFEERGTMLDASQIASKKAEINLLTPPIVEPLSTSGKKDSDFSKIAHYQANRALVYKNIEKLLPFYNKTTIVKYGNLANENSLLYQKELLSAVMMKDNQVITDIVSNKQTANKLLLRYKDDLSEKLDLKYQNDFAKLAEYSLGNTGLLYTPNQFLYDQTSIIKQVLPDLQKVDYHSEDIRKTLGISPNVKQTELYLEDQFAKTKQQLEDSLKKLLSADAGLASANPVTEGYLVDKIKRNKEALLLGLTYLERWYNFSYGQVNVKDLVMYHPDFFGKGNTSPLDTLIELGKSGFNNLLAKNNVDTYAISLASHHGTTDLFSTLENYRKVFLPDKTNNDWFKSQTKAYIVEEKSNIEEVKTKQGLVGTKYSIGVYDRITSDSWKYRNMVLPLLTLPERSVFVISTISSLGFGAYDRYRNKEHQANGDLNSFVEKSAHETAERQRDHYDYWYRILDEKGREKLYRNILLYDAYKFGTDHTEGKATEVADFDNPNPAMQHFFGPVGNKVGHNQHGAYATGDAVYYMGYRMLDKDGAITYTHEMTHDSDQDIYLGGYGRRSGLGPEFFAKGLLQAPDHPDDATITINSILKHSKSDSTESRRLQVLDPTTRFNNADDLKQYVHNMFDVVYMLEYLEGNSILKLDTNQKQQLLRKVTNEYHPDPDGNKVYATNVVRNLTVEEVERLRSFNDLIDNNIISSREYASGKYERNGYFTIKLFAPIYAALSNDDGTPGDLMGRRMAYELLAAKGFKDGMVPYISNQFEADARANNKTITSYGKTKGLVTDTLVLQKLFNGQYNTWSDFKKAMYKERQDKFNKLNKISFKDPSQPWTRNIIKTIHSVNELQNLMNEAVRKDTETPHWYNYNPETDSAVHKLKRAIFKAYLDQTNGFRSSIFENKK
ncbi:ZmpA/ZmpB/ZmpC family metallo-endopeptidase [Streptococcus pneumoniae]|uniref:IgA-protease n=1 Tax=Streptococcus pneumoniae TaxID=1313 RepID=A0A4J2CU40_STREE|nr:ZmpA/ZmpB/ZmpC family metallo-endopeptidase [Streptococcus pneumoniae]MDS2230010.1 ZmpA/ZmpB/ZmpC family metallo-endopeptidase [Streptococcus pneumoniae]MDS2388783.1 ZmpA/ZmpB/ZmpC family metallo-endopeptidase [Streptococcus pneumoniae]MDS2397336.1 ZmpA/ZmpB/ZmpC family metallo-endopeptidase [Streptococcus pneumoniae]MDS2469751.1 ZmpA/ZmpB/ZmpC family metallo-endopeptidase [Streptococcus pneumoniae]MDS2547881.1 ZmpA/ZmpB/ZmpC family metallo-endopeptidase [Streptococcus pneumoniae]